jgi:hypothetical protein
MIMKVQWQLIDIENDKAVAKMGEAFELKLEELAEKFAESYVKDQCKGHSRVNNWNES